MAAFESMRWLTEGFVSSNHAVMVIELGFSRLVFGTLTELWPFSCVTNCGKPLVHPEPNVAPP